MLYNNYRCYPFKTDANLLKMRDKNVVFPIKKQKFYHKCRCPKKMWFSGLSFMEDLNIFALVKLYVFMIETLVVLLLTMVFFIT